MKRNWDIIRDVLVAIEANEGFSALHPSRIPHYDAEAVSYHLLLLKDAGLILAECRHDGASVSCHASSLTWAGHEFLDAIRRDTVWNGIKRTVRERGVDLSFDTIKAVAGKIIDGMLF